MINLEKKVMLSPKKIIAKEFKVDFKGYNAEEVDHFLDMVVNDYEAFAAMLKEKRLFKMIISMRWKKIFLQTLIF